METWLRANLFINDIQVKHLLKNIGTIHSLSSVGKQLTSNAEQAMTIPILYVLQN